VTNDGIVLSWWSATPAAIKAALQVAANAARGSATQVLMEDPSGCQTVLWDSAKDAFTEAEVGASQNCIPRFVRRIP
jgi:hypothetical protein